MTDKDELKLALEKIIKANAKVSAICSGEERWTMSIPARPDHDSDLVIASALGAAMKLIKEALAQPEQEPVAQEVAPPNNLPRWDECALRVRNSDFLAARVATRGYGPEPDSLTANALHRFIYEYDDEAPYASAWFLHRLEQVINELAPHPPQRTEQGDKHD
jgi:hypothetical protein